MNISKYAAEGLATFCLVFMGTSAIVIDHLFGRIGHHGVSVAFGLTAMIMIYAIGHISGAHMNPAVSIAFAATQRMRWSDVPLYIAAQLISAVAASLLVSFLFGDSSFLGATIPSGSWQQSFWLEMIFTSILMFVIMGVAHDDRAEGVMAGVAIGATVMVEALIGGPISGASMNPARSFGPAVVSGHIKDLPLYFVAPILGALIGAWCYRAIRCDQKKIQKTCC